jgi:4'-phosphopantetheinyl transferase
MINNELIVMKISLKEPLYWDVLSYIPYSRGNQLTKHYRKNDIKLSLYAELVVRIKALTTLGLDNERINIIRTIGEKPYINEYPEIQFNISHSGNLLVVGFSRERIGVDVEQVMESNFHQIAKRFFTEDEYNYIYDGNNPKYQFYEIWTKKEVYAKYLGKGLAMPLNSFAVLDKHIDEKLFTMQ